jgi:isopentenyl phosphate kinase
MDLYQKVTVLSANNKDVAIRLRTVCIPDLLLEKGCDGVEKKPVVTYKFENRLGYIVAGGMLKQGEEQLRPVVVGDLHFSDLV